MTVPSAARIRPRSIRCCSSSGRLLASFSFSASASKTDQYEVKPTRSAKRTTKKANSLTIWRFTGLHRLHRQVAAADRRGGLTAGPVGDQQQQRQQDEVGDDRAAAVADEGQGDAGQRDHPGDAADDDEGLEG